MDFSNKVVLVTDGSCGIGAETAKYVARRGAEVSMSGRNENAIKRVAAQCKKLGGVEPLLTAGDVTDQHHLHSLIEKTIEKFGKLDVLVNSTGIFQFGSIDSLEIIKQYDYMFNANVKPIIFLISTAIPYLEKTKGNIVNISSIAGIRSLPDLIVYSMSKSSLDQLTRSTAMELASKRIRVNAVNPGTMDSPLYDKTETERYSYFEKVKHFHPLGRIGTPQEVASVIGYLASDEASFITGTTLSVDGGRHCLYETFQSGL